METPVINVAKALSQALLVGLIACQGARCQAPQAGNPNPGPRVPKSATLRTDSHPSPEFRNPNPDLMKARWHVLGARPLGLFYYSSDSRGLKSLQSNASLMTLLGPQCFWVDEQGIVHGEIPPQVVEVARQAKLPIMPLVINPRFDQALARALLRNPQAQERAAVYLAYLAHRDNYVGLQLDLEHIDPADQGRYSRFVARVARRLHRDHRLLSVAVVPRFSDKYPDRKANEFRTGEWGAPYDYRALGRIADFVTLMTYDHHGESDPPGPVAGYEWVEAAVHYAVARIPRSKLLLGIPFYGREWVQPSAPGPTPKARSLAFPDAQELLGRPGIASHWDDRWRTGWFEYHDASGQHTGWYEDSKSLAAKLLVMRRYRLRGFAAWRLGEEDPRFWALQAPALRSGPQNARSGAGTRPAPTARPKDARLP
jgi:spore germination protein